MRAQDWAADDEERAFTGELADRAGSAGEGTGTFVPGVGVKGTPVWGEEEGKEMKGRGEPEGDGTGMRSSRLSDGGGGGMGKGSSRSSADGEMNFRRVRTLRRWRVKLRVWRRYLVTRSGLSAFAEAPALEIWSRTGVAAGPHAPNVSTTIGTKPRPLARHSSRYLGSLTFFSYSAAATPALTLARGKSEDCWGLVTAKSRQIG